MKIFTDRSLIRNTSTSPQKKTTGKEQMESSDVQHKTKNTGFDQIMISRTSDTKLTDDQFISQLSKQLSGEVKAGASSYVLEDLQRQIALNQYDINPSDIARKLVSE